MELAWGHSQYGVYRILTQVFLQLSFWTQPDGLLVLQKVWTFFLTRPFQFVQG